MTNNNELGKEGEELAKNFLINLNYSIIQTNWHFGHLEIDIIAETPSTIIFCEVKTRSSDKLSSPENSVNFQKQRNIIKAANHFVLKNGINKEVRFDIISIIQKKNGPAIQHIPDAFTPRW